MGKTIDVEVHFMDGKEDKIQCPEGVEINDIKPNRDGFIEIPDRDNESNRIYNFAHIRYIEVSGHIDE